MKLIPIEDVGFRTRIAKAYMRGNPNDCWEWKGTISTAGYGVLYKAPYRYYAHRSVFSIHHSRQIRAGLVIDHKCSNRKCVNPHHMQEVTLHKNIELEFARKPELNAKRLERIRSFTHHGLPTVHPNTTPLPVLICRGECLHGHKINTFDDLTKGKRNKCLRCQTVHERNWSKRNYQHVKEYRQAWLRRRAIMKGGAH